MATTNTIKMKIQFRRDTAANWAAVKDTVTPGPGEPCFETDTGVFKIGDGVKTYGELEPIGGVKVDADGRTIVLEEGVFKLAGFDAAEVGAQPRKKSDGTIEWVVPSTETVDGLKTTVSGMQSDIKTLQDIVGASGEGNSPLLNRVGTLEDQIGIINGDATVEGSVLKTVRDEINDFATKVSDDKTVNTIKELVDYVAEHGSDVEKITSDIVDLKGLVGSSKVSDQISAAIIGAGHVTREEANNTFLSKIEAAATLKKVKYEVVHKPTGTLVDYRDKEIRIMCPADTKFSVQNSGEGADTNKFYIGFKAYAPVGAVGFKEDTAEIIADDTMHTFEGNDFAGIDAYGRKYSIIWLPVAALVDGTWAYYGAKSSTSKYVGWYYSVEWYDADGGKIATDCIRINLSNEACHSAIEPFYMANVIKEVAVGGTVIDAVNGRVNIPVNNIIKGSDEIEVAEDGTITIKTISLDKIAQSEAGDIVFDGGSANG